MAGREGRLTAHQRAPGDALPGRVLHDRAAADAATRRSNTAIAVAQSLASAAASPYTYSSESAPRASGAVAMAVGKYASASAVFPAAAASRATIRA